MSKKKVTKKSSIKPTQSTVVKQSSDVFEKDINSSNSGNLLFGKQNYIYILGGIGLMIIGFFLMAGGSMPSPDVWDDSIIYSTRRTLIAPIFILAGLVLQVVAIFKK